MDKKTTGSTRMNTITTNITIPLINLIVGHPIEFTLTDKRKKTDTHAIIALKTVLIE